MARVLKLDIQLDGAERATQGLARVETAVQGTVAAGKVSVGQTIQMARSYDALRDSLARAQVDRHLGLQTAGLKSARESAQAFALHGLGPLASASEKASLSHARLITATAGLSNAMVALSSGSAPGPATIGMLTRIAVTGGPAAAAFVGVGVAAAGAAAILGSSVKEYAQSSGLLEQNREAVDGLADAWHDAKFRIGQAVLGARLDVERELGVVERAVRSSTEVIEGFIAQAKRSTPDMFGPIGMGMGHFDTLFGAAPGQNLTSRDIDGNLTAFGWMQANERRLRSGGRFTGITSTDIPDIMRQADMDRRERERLFPEAAGGSSSFLTGRNPFGNATFGLPGGVESWNVALDNERAMLEAFNDAFLEEQRRFFDEEQAAIDSLMKGATESHAVMTDAMTGQMQDYGASALQTVQFVGQSIATLAQMTQAIADAQQTAMNIALGGPGGVGLSAWSFLQDRDRLIRRGGEQSGSIGWVPHLAEGGIVQRPTFAMIGERGPEAVVPLGRGGAGGVTVNITINAQPGQNAKEIAEVVQGEIVRRMSRFLPGRV